MTLTENAYPGDPGIHCSSACLAGENTRFYACKYKIAKPATVHFDIPASHICLLTAEEGAFVHQHQGRQRWLAKSLTDIFYCGLDKLSLEFPTTGSFGFYLLEINAALIKPRQNINADLHYLVSAVTSGETVCLGALPFVMDLEERILLEDLLSFSEKQMPAGFVDTQCLLFFIRSVEKIIRRDLNEGSEMLPAYDQENLESVIAEISADPGLKTPIPELARKFGLSPSRFKQLFKKQYGLSIHQFILKLRIDRATDLLMRGSLSVREIAVQLGYAGEASFSTVFKKKTGMNPLELKRKRTG